MCLNKCWYHAAKFSAHAWKAGSFRSHVKNIGHTKFLSKDELKYLKPKDRGSKIKFEIKAPTYFPTNERIAETPPLNFETPVDPDLLKGLGSFLGTACKDYQK